MSAYFPVALDLRGRGVLVVGAGPVAARKAQALLEAEAKVRVVAPQVGREVADLAQPGFIELRRRPYEPADLDDVHFVIAATDDPSVNAKVARDARDRRILVNAADDPANCDAILPAVVHRGDVQVAITTGGRSPALARHLRERLETLLPEAYGPLAKLLSQLRAELKREGIGVEADAWQRAIDDAVLDLIADGEERAALGLLRDRLTGESSYSPTAPSPAFPRQGGRGSDTASSPRTGRIVLVGAGPGDEALITVAGQRAIAEADVIVYDRLVNPSLLDHAPPDTRLIYAGKAHEPGCITQGEINHILCEEARSGRVVVRLKGGDPFVFGRGGEEALAAREAGIPFTVVPGVSSSIAAPAYAGIPVTHRGLASSFTVVTCHEDGAKGDSQVNWEALARVGGTLVLLMGAQALKDVCRRLVSAGLPGRTPAAVVHCATTNGQRVVTGRLDDIAEVARAASIVPPATTVIGEVASLADVLSWWGDRRSS